MDSRWLEMVIEGTEEAPARYEGSKPVLYYKTRTIRSGRMTEVEIYPVFSWGYRRQASKARPTAQAQRKVNDRNAQKRFHRLAACNFQEGVDYAMTLTYEGAAPADERQLDRDLRNYLARVNRARKKQGLPKARCMGVKQTGDKNGRLHHHILISGGISRDEMERLWGHGYANCDRLQHGKGGLIAMVKYMTRGFQDVRAQGRHRYFYTRNLVQPKVTESRTKVSIRMAERIRQDADQYGESTLIRKYPGHQLEDIQIYQTDWMPGAYIYARMRRL